MTYTAPRNRRNASYKTDESIITTTGIESWNLLEDSGQKSQSDVSKYSGSIKDYQERHIADERIHNRILKKTKKYLKEHKNLSGSSFYNRFSTGKTPFPKSKLDLFIDSESYSEVEYLLQILRSDEISQLHEINSLFFINERIEVTNYLIENSSLVPILLEAYSWIEKTFKGNKQLSLKLCLDPDTSDWEKLLLLIHVGYDADVDEIFSLKEYLDDNWWIDIYSLTPTLDINISFDEF